MSRLIFALLTVGLLIPAQSAAWFELAPPLTAPHQGRPRVATDGVNFLAAWMEADFAGANLRAAIFTAGGDRLALVDVPFSMRHSAPVFVPWTINPPAVAYGGGVYALVWSWRDSIYAVRVSTTGVILDPAPLVLTSRLQDAPSLAVASNGRSFLAAWKSAQRFEKALIPLYGSAEPATPVRSGPAPERGATLGIGCCNLASDGENYLMLWLASEYYPGEYFDHVLWRRMEMISIDASGASRTPAPIVMADASGGPMVWNGNGYTYLARGEGTRSLILRTLDREGNLAGERTLWFNAFTSPIALTVTGSDSIVAYQSQEKMNVPRNFIARLGADGSLRHFAFGGVVPSYSRSWADLTANDAGEVVVVVNAVPPGETGSNPRVLVYTAGDFVLQPPARSRSRAVRR